MNRGESRRFSDLEVKISVLWLKDLLDWRLRQAFEVFGAVHMWQEKSPTELRNGRTCLFGAASSYDQ